MKFTKSKLLKLKPCADGLDYAASLNFNFARIYNECERGDWLIWWLRKSVDLDKPKAVKLAIICAQHVLKIFEKKYPNDNRPRKAIEAAIQFLKNPADHNRTAADGADAAYVCTVAVASSYADAYAGAAADAAGAASSAAYAAAASAAADAHAAACAAAAASAAAGAAAAYAGYNPDAAADAAYAAAKLKERKWQADQIRKIIPNPFK